MENPFSNAQAVQAKLAEEALVGGVLRYPDGLHDAAAIVRVEDFYDPCLGIVWGAMLQLAGENRKADVVAVADCLYRQKQLDQIGPMGEAGGGYGFLAEIYDRIPTGANAAYYAGLVRDHAILRNLVLAAHRILALAQAPTGTAMQMLAESEQEIFAVADMGCAGMATPVGPTVDEVLDEIDERMSQPQDALPGIPTGISGLDTLTAGFASGSLFIVAARPSIGKTALASAMALSVCKDGHNVLFCSLEQSRQELALRFLTATSGVDGQNIRHAALTGPEMQRLGGARQVLRPLPLWIDDGGQQSVLRIAANARRIKRKHGLSLIVVDYLQLVDPENPKASRNEQVGTISRKLKLLAKDLGVPIVALSQLNRESEARTGGRPRLCDLRDSGGIEQDADSVLLLHKTPDAPDILQLILAKNRNGPVGEFEVLFDRGRMEFRAIDDNPFTKGARA